METTDTQRYEASVAQLEHALELGKKYLPLELLKQGHQVVTAARQRLELGVDHTIVALAGGTGSGKSSTFNALSGLEFADVGVHRPTTVRTAACTWDSDATALLDWVGVDHDRRISRDTALDGEDQARLKGLILLDLPDHDSIAEHHKEIVNKVVPLVDVLVWVVDPQKYADQALHAEYLRKMVDAKASMIVALNQIDTVRVEQRDELIWDVARLLADDGLSSVNVRPISAKTGEGIAPLRDELRAAVTRRSMASRRLTDELLKLARQIDAQVPGGVVTDLSSTSRAEADRYLVAAGIPALADEVCQRTARNDSLGEAPKVQVPSSTTLAGLRSRWIDRITEPMHDSWARAVSDSAGTTDALERCLTAELTSIEVPWGPVHEVKRWGPYACLAVGIAAFILAVLGFTSVLGSPLTGLLFLGVGVLSAVGMWWTRRRIVSRLREAGRDRAEELREVSAQAAARVIDGVLFTPIEGILKAHDEVSRIADHVISMYSSAQRDDTA